MKIQDYFPGNNGLNCPFNGLHTDTYGRPINCKCDNCDYALCCFDEATACSPCTYPLCSYATMLKTKQHQQ